MEMSGLHQFPQWLDSSQPLLLKLWKKEKVNWPMTNWESWRMISSSSYLRVIAPLFPCLHGSVSWLSWTRHSWESLAAPPHWAPSHQHTLENHCMIKKGKFFQHWTVEESSSPEATDGHDGLLLLKQLIFKSLWQKLLFICLFSYFCIMLVGTEHVHLTFGRREECLSYWLMT